MNKNKKIFVKRKVQQDPKWLSTSDFTFLGKNNKLLQNHKNADIFISKLIETTTNDQTNCEYKII